MIVMHSAYHVFGSGSASRRSRIHTPDGRELRLREACDEGLIAAPMTLDRGHNGFVGEVDADVWALAPGPRVSQWYSFHPGSSGETGPAPLPRVIYPETFAREDYRALLESTESDATFGLILADWLDDRSEGEAAEHFRRLARAEQSRQDAAARIRGEEAAAKAAERAKYLPWIDLVERHSGRWTVDRMHSREDFLCDVGSDSARVFLQAAQRQRARVSAYPGRRTALRVGYRYIIEAAS